jgi:hypothetical protein
MILQPASNRGKGFSGLSLAADWPMWRAVNRL